MATSSNHHRFLAVVLLIISTTPGTVMMRVRVVQCCWADRSRLPVLLPKQRHVVVVLLSAAPDLRPQNPIIPVGTVPEVEQAVVRPPATHHPTRHQRTLPTVAPPLDPVLPQAPVVVVRKALIVTLLPSPTDGDLHHHPLNPPLHAAYVVLAVKAAMTTSASAVPNLPVAPLTKAMSAPPPLQQQFKSDVVMVAP